jgi:hypothetical protein
MPLSMYKYEHENRYLFEQLQFLLEKHVRVQSGTSHNKLVGWWYGEDVTEVRRLVIWWSRTFSLGAFSSSDRLLHWYAIDFVIL